MVEIGAKFPWLPSVVDFRGGGANERGVDWLAVELGRPKSDFTTGGANDLGGVIGLAPALEVLLEVLPRVLLSELAAELAALSVFLRRSSAALPTLVFNLLAAELNWEPTELAVGLAPKLEVDWNVVGGLAATRGANPLLLPMIGGPEA